jgi:hypothetical protein
MLEHFTVFVIGAGAGDGLNMPLGDQLSAAIAEAVNFYFEEGGRALTRGQPRIAQAVRQLARSRGCNMNEYIAAGRMIAGGIRYTKSIDNYIHAHSDKEAVKAVAKIAIVDAIINAEKGSHLWVDETEHPSRFQNGTSVRQSWMYDFFGLLQEGIVESRNLETIFDNLAIINFNYDRCVEHFLYRALHELYPTKGEAYISELITKKLHIIHPYGAIGRLPWQGGTNIIRFGGEVENDLVRLSSQIRTFNEEIEEGEETERMRDLLMRADRLVFLGCHFHKQNMALLQTKQSPKTGGAPAIYATAFNRPSPDIPIIRKRIANVLSGRGTVTTLDGTCKDLFRDYSVTLGG